MDIEEKQKIAERMTARVSTGLAFINHFLYLYNKTDAAYLRSFYILLSYNFELLLKSRVVVLSHALDINKLNRELQELLHDFVKISQKLEGNELSKIGIKNIILDKVSSNYIINTIGDKKLCIKDFNDIRYDFISGKIYNVNNYEHEKIKLYIDIMSDILTKVKKVNDEN